ncbi:MAG: methyltransferase, partial [Actinomycetes bacterium]
MTCFSSADESAHYGFSVCMLLEQYRSQLGWEEEGVVELGTGDATAIADVVRSLPGLRVRSYDISSASVEAARANIADRGVSDRYTVELGDFFDQADAAGGPPVSTVISNPPYIPAPDRDILMPELWGGVRGNDLMLQLLKAGYDNVVTAVASYSDPLGTVGIAGDLGYRVGNFLAMGLDFGRYSSEPKVRDHIRRLCAEGHGWA